MAYWWCVKHNTVEQGSSRGWFHAGRLGPYDTPEAARAALRQVADRNEKAEAEDRAWEEGHPSP